MLLNHFSIKGRMYLVIFSIFVLFLVMLLFTFYTTNRVKEFGLNKTSAVMLQDQKEKLQVASHTVALAVGHALEGVEAGEKQYQIIRMMIDDIRFEKDESGYYFVYSGTTNVALPPKKELQGKDLADLKDTNGLYLVRELRDIAGSGGGFVEYIWPKPGAGDVAKLGYAEMIPGTNMWIGTGVYLDNISTYQAAMASDINGQVKTTILTMFFTAGAIFVGIITLCLVIIFGIIRNIKGLIQNFQDVAEGEGDLTKRITITSQDEIGELGRWFNVFMEKLQTIIRSISQQTTSLGGESESLSKVASNLAHNARDSSERCSNVARAAEEMTTNLGTVAAAMEQSTINTNMVASAAEEMTATINEIASNANEAYNVSQQAVLQARGTSIKMAELDKAALAISKVTETITEISEQTNLLALNATIEAARAGEAGKGFAVVANEIKELAKQTAEATMNIKQQIEGVQGTTTATVADINQVSSVIENINQLIITISSSIGEQRTVTEEVASNITQAATGLGEVNENVSQISVVAANINREIAGINSTTNEISKNSINVDGSGSHLRKLSEDLQKAVANFKV